MDNWTRQAQDQLDWWIWWTAWSKVYLSLRCGQFMFFLFYPKLCQCSYGHIDYGPVVYQVHQSSWSCGLPGLVICLGWQFMGPVVCLVLWSQVQWTAWSCWSARSVTAKSPWSSRLLGQVVYVVLRSIWSSRLLGPKSWQPRWITESGRPKTIWTDRFGGLLGLKSTCP